MAIATTFWLARSGVSRRPSETPRSRRRQRDQRDQRRAPRRHRGGDRQQACRRSPARRARRAPAPSSAGTRTARVRDLSAGSLQFGREPASGPPLGVGARPAPLEARESRDGLCELASPADDRKRARASCRTGGNDPGRRSASSSLWRRRPPARRQPSSGPGTAGARAGCAARAGPPTWSPTRTSRPSRRSGRCSPSAAPTTRSSARRAARPATASTRWVVDPLDGTINYLFGIPGVRRQRRLRGRLRHACRRRARPVARRVLRGHPIGSTDAQRRADSRGRPSRTASGSRWSRPGSATTLRFAPARQHVVARVLPQRARHPARRRRRARPRLERVRPLRRVLRARTERVGRRRRGAGRVKGGTRGPQA